MSDTHKNWGDPKHFQMFSDDRIALAGEIKHHPDLVELLQNHPQEEFEELLSEVASYCQVVLDGDYYQSDLDKLCGILYNKLVYKRTGLSIAHMEGTDITKLNTEG